MKTTIYYFSGTGNTKFYAEQVAKNLEECELISIASAIDRDTIELNGSVGIFFPVYVWGLPKIVDRFITKSDFSKVSYLFMGSTGGGSAGASYKQAMKLFSSKNVILNYGFFSQLPGNATTVYNAFSKEKCHHLKQKCIEKSVIVARNITNRYNEIEKFHFIFTILNGIMYKGFIKALSKFDSEYIITKDCNGCGVCEEVCPVSNIIFKQGVPQFNGKCEGCLACYNRCPELAIKVKKDKGKRRYSINIAE